MWRFTTSGLRITALWGSIPSPWLAEAGRLVAL